MNLQRLFALLTVASGLISTGAMADEGSISFSGEVTNSACRVLGAGQSNLISTTTTVILPTVSLEALNTFGEYAGHTRFTILLAGCQAQANLNNVYTAFTTTSPTATDSNVMANTETTSPATGIGLAILDYSTATQIDLNGGTRRDTARPLPPSGSPSMMEMRYIVAYKVLALPVTAGGVRGQVNYTLAYN